MEMLEKIENVLDRIPLDFGGGSPLEKVFLMSHLAATRRLKVYVEIGVYRGRSLFPVATAMHLHGGRVFGIDPYSKACAHENDIASEYVAALHDWVEKTNFDDIYLQVTNLVADLGLESTVELLRVPSEQAVSHFQGRDIQIGMLHVDGNHDTRCVMRDVELYLPLVAPNGIVVMDDINWASVQPAYAKVKERMTVLFEAPEFSFLINRPDGADLDELKQGLALMHAALALRSSTAEASRVGVPLVPAGLPENPKVSVSLTTYNQERYIATAIESVLAQQTDFPFEVVLADDRSTDGTGDICREYQRRYPGIVRLVHREKNLGAVPNYLETFKACVGEYVAFLEGDDYWTDPNKLQKQVAFLDANPEYAICCHNVIAVDDQGVSRGGLLRNVSETTTVKDLCRGDYISTPSCMVRNHLLDELPSWIYALPGCDWALDLLHAEKGKIQFFPETMAAYRIHTEGIWSGKCSKDKLRETLEVTQTINRRLDYRHAKDFQVLEQLIRHEIKKFQAQGEPAVTESVVMSSNDALIREYETAMFELEKAKSLARSGKRELRALKRSHQELKNQYKQALRIIASAEAWQRRSWITRALHRWRSSRKAGGVRVERPKAAEKSPEPSTGAQPLKREANHIQPTLSSVSAPAPLAAVASKYSLVILDDIFPHPLSAFRFEEYARYLESIPDMMVYSTAGAFGCLREKRSLEEVIFEAEERHSWIKGRVTRFEPKKPLNATLAYVVFLGNIAYFLDRLEEDKIPFVFTLYPGGSFELNDPMKDRVMRRVFSSPQFRKVIVTQNITQEYLIEHDFCAPEQITYVQGGVTPAEHLTRDLKGKKHFGFEKAQLDICFVAHRYSSDGADKGYDVFIEVARRFVARHDNVFFHVVGGFDQSIIDVSDLGGRISFYGMQEPAWFETFYMDKDLILSPNIPFTLAPGAFDGFPTGCCTDAALHSVAMFCTDLLKLNQNFTDGKDIVLIPYNVDRITEIIEHYHRSPADLRSLARQGCETSRYICGYEYQMAPRLNLLQELIQEGTYA